MTEYTPNIAFDILAGKAWRSARDVADMPGVLPEARAYMNSPQNSRSAANDTLPNLIPTGRGR